MHSRDTDILTVLTHKVRLLSISQVASAWWDGTAHAKRNAAQCLSRLERDGLVTLKACLAHPEFPVVSPLATWTVGAEAPNLAALAFKLKTRWRGASERTVVVVATELAGTWLGGHGGRLPRTSEVSHDILLAAVFLHFRKNDPTRASHWVSEATLHAEGEGRGDRLPDAMVRGRREKTVIECGGAYPRTKLEEFHCYCERRGLGYEVW